MTPKRCSLCRKRVNITSLDTCSECNESICRDCLYTCVVCEATICESCAYFCESCGEPVCSKCIIIKGDSDRPNVYCEECFTEMEDEEDIIYEKLEDHA